MDKFDKFIDEHYRRRLAETLEASRRQKDAMAAQLAAFTNYAAVQGSRSAAMTADAELSRIMAQVRGE